MATWPTGFPAPLQSGFDQQPDQRFVRTDFEAGPSRMRRRAISGVDKLNVTWLLTRAQKASFDTWWTTDIMDGVGWFTISLDLGGGEASYDMRFVEPYRASLVNHDIWRISAPVEIRT